MNNEFKKLSQGEVTRYVLENASGGGTSSGSVASVSMPIGGTRKRGNNLIAQEADKKTVPASTPRNFVAKNAKTAGAGAHKDKSKTIPRKEKHKKPFMEDRDHPDHEIQMASSELMSIAKNAQSLLDMVQRYSEQEGLDAWQQSKITKAADYLNSVLQSINGEQQGVEEGDAGLSKDAETNFHAKLDQLVHATFGKRKEEQGVAEGAPELLKKEMPLHRHAEKLLAQNGVSKDDPDYHHHLNNTIKYLRQFGNIDLINKSDEQGVAEEWSKKYKSSINCSHPKGFSQKAHCAGKKKHNESMMTMEAVCPDCGMCQTHGDNMMEVKQRLDPKCWTGKHKEGTKIKGGVRVNNCVPNEGVDTYFESLQQMVERQLEPAMDLDAWVDNFQNADPNKYHQFKNKTPEKKK